MKKEMERRSLKEFPLEDGSLLLEVGGELLIHIPPDLEGERERHSGCFIGSPEEGVTRKGRKIIRFRPGKTHYVSWGHGGFSREWDGWFDWPDHPEIKSWAAAESRGGGQWWEVWCWPARFGRVWVGTWRPDPQRVELEELEEEIGAPEQP